MIDDECRAPFVSLGAVAVFCGRLLWDGPKIVTSIRALKKKLAPVSTYCTFDFN